jgi:hypothetical protein
MASVDEKGSFTQHPLPKAHDVTNNLDDVGHDIDSGEINELVVVAEGEERTTWFVWILVLCSSISGLLFGAFPFHVTSQSTLNQVPGYDTGVISGALVTIGSDLGPEALSNGQKVSCVDLAALRFLWRSVQSVLYSVANNHVLSAVLFAIMSVLSRDRSFCVAWTQDIFSVLMASCISCCF